jgi:hypothetical protein
LKGSPIVIDASLSYDEYAVYNKIKDDKDLLFNWKIEGDALKDNNLKSLHISYEQYIGITSSELYVELNLSKPDGRSTSKTFNITIIDNDNANLTDLISINLSEDNVESGYIVYSSYFIDSTMENIKSLLYQWTVNDKKANDNNIYLNGRNNKIVKIKSEILNLGNNDITLSLNDNNTTYTFNNIYKLSPPPYGGFCITDPKEGISLNTKIRFTNTNWHSDNLPISYRYFTHQNSSLLYLSEPLFTTVFETALIPPSEKIYVRVADSKGISTISECELKIHSVDNYDINLFPLKSDSDKLVLSRVIQLNNIPLEVSMIDESVDIIKNMISEDLTFTQNFDLIISQLKSFSKFSSMTDVITQVGLKSHLYINNTNKVEQVFDLLHETKSDEVFTNLTNKIFDNILPGETKSIKTTKELIKISKSQSFSFNKDGSTECSIDSIICLDSNNKNGIIAVYTLNENDSFSTDSFKFEIKETYPEPEKPTYEVNLNTSDLKDIPYDKISQAVCVVYDKNNEGTPSYCKTYFNYENNKVSCKCNSMGQIKVILNSKLARLSIANQFLLENVGICNIFLI